MHDPTQNPTKNPQLAGKSRRFATGVQAFRRFASDTPTERAIVTLKTWLAGKVEAGDVVSVSLLARRALAVYLDHCAALYGAGNIELEREVVRINSRMPNPNPRKRKKPLVRRSRSKKPHVQAPDDLGF